MDKPSGTCKWSGGNNRCFLFYNSNLTRIRYVNWLLFFVADCFFIDWLFLLQLYLMIFPRNLDLSCPLFFLREVTSLSRWINKSTYPTKIISALYYLTQYVAYLARLINWKHLAFSHLVDFGPTNASTLKILLTQH